MFELDLARLHAFGHKGKRLCHAAKGRIGCKPAMRGFRRLKPPSGCAPRGGFDSRPLAREEVSAIGLHRRSETDSF